MSTPGFIWVEPQNLERAVDALAEAGIDALPQHAPIVDVADPICPTCGATLDPERDPPCPACGAAFDWVDTSEAPYEEDVPSPEEDAAPSMWAWRRSPVLYVVIMVAAILLLLLTFGL